VRAQHDRDAAAAQLAQQVADHPPADRVERARGLVEHEQPRRADQRLRDAQPLLHALGHGGDLCVACLGEPDQLEQLCALRGAAVRARQLLMELEQLVGAQPVRETEQLREVADRGARLGGAGRRALDLGPPAGGAHQAAGDLRERRLARAVRAEQPEQLPGRHLQVHSAERHRRAVALLERLAAKGSGHRPQCRKLPGCR
jgi:hypothetical protein